MSFSTKMTRFSCVNAMMQYLYYNGKTMTYRSQEDFTALGHFNFGMISRDFLIGALTSEKHRTKMISKTIK